MTPATSALPDDVDTLKAMLVVAAGEKAGLQVEAAALKAEIARLALINERAETRIPHGHWKTTTLVAGLSTDGIIAPMVMDGAMDGEMFSAYVETLLAPCLMPGDIVIMDNLPAHKSCNAKQAIEARGATLIFLPAYSPDFNPIEKAIAQIKAFLKKAAARTKADLDAAIAKAIDLVTPQNAVNYFAACGYQPDTV